MRKIWNFLRSAFYMCGGDLLGVLTSICLFHRKDDAPFETMFFGILLFFVGLLCFVLPFLSERKEPKDKKSTNSVAEEDKAKLLFNMFCIGIGFIFGLAIYESCIMLGWTLSEINW
jgi:uncharacterized membrane protein YfcA